MTAPVVQVDEQIAALQQEVVLLQQEIYCLIWLHTELSGKHDALVAQLQNMLNTFAGPQGGGIEAVRAQAIKQRAIRIARHRAAQNPAT